MDLELTGKVAVVTGASTGIGRATALALAAEGVTVVGASRRPPDDDVVGVTHLAMDLREPDAPVRLIDAAIARHGRLDILVNNAAAGTITAGFVDESPAAWTETLQLNLLAAVRTMQAALAHLVERGGVIINVTSVNARLPSSESVAYSASKAALLNAGKAVATEYAARGVRVVTVSPGLTATPMWLGPTGVAEQIAASAGMTADEVAHGAADGTPLKRFLRPEELANCICFLASPRASAVTGTEVVVDGGLTPTI